MSNPFASSLRSTVAINVNLLTGAGCGYLAWTLWPSAPEWWGLGVMSVLLGMGALIACGKALREMVALRRRDRALQGYLGLGGAPKAARLATTDDLRRAGMLDD